MTHSVRVTSFLLLVLLLPLVSDAGSIPESSLPRDGTDPGQQFRDFAAVKEAEVRRVAESKAIDMPFQVDQFFDLA